MERNTLEHVLKNSKCWRYLKVTNAENLFWISYAFQSSREFGEVWSARPNRWLLRLIRVRLRNGRFFVGHLFGDFEDPSIFTAKSCKVKDQFCEIFEVLQMQCIYIYKYMYSSWKDLCFCGNCFPNQDHFPWGSCSTWNGTWVQAASDGSGIHFGLNIDRIIIGETIGRVFHTQSSGNVSTIVNAYLWSFVYR